MKRISFAKVGAIVILALFLGFFDLPSSKQQSIMPWLKPSTEEGGFLNWLNNQKVNLGLDLQGGTQLDYKIDLSQIKNKIDQETIVEGVKQVINKRVNGMGVKESNIYVSKYGNEQHIVVELAGVNVDEAKKVVGKTIQLEFKEEKLEPDPGEKDRVKSKAAENLKKIKEGADFVKFAEEAKKGNAGKIDFFQTQSTYYFADQLGKVGTQLVAMKPGDITPELIETMEMETGAFFNSHTGDPGFSIFKVVDKKDEEREFKKEKEVKASHILASYAEAAKANKMEGITRTEEEAKKRAEEVLQKLKSGGKFEDLAKEYSDDSANKDKGGKLEITVIKDASYDQAFKDAALALTKEKPLSEIIKSSVGFHIIRADEVKEATTEKKVEPKIKYAVLFFSAKPDPWKATALTGKNFKRADVQIDQSTYSPYISISFDEEGAKLFEEITGRNVGKPVAIFVGGEEISSPRVNEKISGGKAQITGNFTMDDATALARDLNTGAIPAPISLTGELTIGASLGQDALNKSIKAGLWGILAVAIFMILYYRLPGLIAVFALSIYSILLLFAIKSSLPLSMSLVVGIVIFVALIGKILKSTEAGWEKVISFLISCFVLFFVTYLLSTAIVLTLAGVAGIILSIGMAVDANILIFERVKEELRAGRTLSTAIDVGFDRAWSSIRDSNFSSLITCAILFYFGSSIIQGFAFNLAAGILISLFSAITITKTFLYALIYGKLSKNLWYFGLPKENKEKKQWDIIGTKNFWFTISGILAVLSIIIISVFGLKLGMDFTGGTLLEVKLPEATATVEQVQTALIEVKDAKGQPTEFDKAVIVKSTDNDFIIRSKTIDDETYKNVLAKLNEKFKKAETIKFTSVGPTIGETMKSRAIIAILLASLMIIIYIAFAFRKIPKRLNPWAFGVCAVVALIHDILITFGVYVVLTKYAGIEIDALLITALLTILGFSVHDTIVVYDRIRENLRLQKKDETLDQVANISMNQTIARSINTSMTAFLTVAALFLMGAASIKYFAFILMFGIIIGTYSSIFIASALLITWKKWQGQR